MSNTTTPYCVGKWMPSDQHVLNTWLRKIHAKAEDQTGPLLPAVQQLKTFIETDATAYMAFTQLFDEVPPWRHKSPSGLPQVRDYEHMLRLFNVIMTEAPEYNDSGVVGFPFNAILDWSMDTVGGYAGFLNEKVNAHLRAMLNEWAIFLRSAASTKVLNDQGPGGWFCKDALKHMPGFAEEFQCDPGQPHYGFTSWDDFFTRRFRDGQRPVADPADDAVIVNACESAPYCVAEKVQLRDKFWIKGQPYAVQFMMGGDPLAGKFDGGTVYQAFLSALSYHRWHAPVSGRIVKTARIPGTYYSELLTARADPSGPNDSQGYITEVATRALIFIEADNPAIGLMCFMPVGMAEVSTCDITVFEGQHVKKGDELGMFHFGGSTHCLFFRPGVKLAFDLHGQQPGLNSCNIPVRSRIATVQS
ncbi:phosphatidylserine decarboxylase family protein [Massilia sp. 9096]|uniref:phosphatidylserine decarboxylase family protein n=1 Tax=Massilia sp. 9096 TaxID=1500894 RepID=UPI00055A08D2|nr:phosphatidylserine decarboxylase family protein [Massilia sp. 9096]